MDVYSPTSPAESTVGSLQSLAWSQLPLVLLDRLQMANLRPIEASRYEIMGSPLAPAVIDVQYPVFPTASSVSVLQSLARLQLPLLLADRAQMANFSSPSVQSW